MLTEEQLKLATELLTAAVNYNMALHSAFVSQDSMVEVDLTCNGVTERVSIPTYHYLLQQVDKLSRQVAQMQITDDGHDVIELLTTTDNLALLYLQKRQFYVRPPKEASIVKYDYETCPTMFSGADKSCILIDLSKCELPMDAQYIIAQYDNDQQMRLPILFKTTCMDSIANVLSANEVAGVTTYTLDSNDLQVGSMVQCHSNVYKVTSISGQTVQLESLQPTVIKPIVAGDVLYSVTDQTQAFVEVPIYSVYKKELALQVQYMQLLSAKNVIDVSTMRDEIHATAKLPLKSVISGRSLQDNLNVLNLAIRPVPSNIEEIISAATPNINKVTVLQTNTHQYIHSALENMLQANAVIVQAKQDIQRLELYINELLSAQAVGTGVTLYDKGDRGSAGAQSGTEPDQAISIAAEDIGSSIISYKEQLASAKARYNAAQATLASISVASQDVRAEYVANVHCSLPDISELIAEAEAELSGESAEESETPTGTGTGTIVPSVQVQNTAAQQSSGRGTKASQNQGGDSAVSIVHKNLVQFIARYQRLSLSVNDTTNDWQYVYGEKRMVDIYGDLMHPQDLTNVMNKIALPIHAYERLAIQVSAVLSFGQPLLTCQTGWTDTIFTEIPAELLKEVTLDDMFKNVYEARLYTSIQQAMTAAGVFKHIDVSSQWAHKAQDILFQDATSLYEILQQFANDINYLRSGISGQSLALYMQVGTQAIQISNGASIEIEAPDSYYDRVFGGLTNGDDIQDALGTVVEDYCNLLVVNPNAEPLYLHTIIPGNGSTELTKADNPEYADIPFIEKSKFYIGNNYVINDITLTKAPVQAMAAYRKAHNAMNNSSLIQSDKNKFCYIVNGDAVNINQQISASDETNCFSEATSSTNPQRIVTLVRNLEGSVVNGIAKKGDYDYPGIGIHQGFPMWYGAQLDDNSMLSLISTSDYGKYTGVLGDENNPQPTQAQVASGSSKPWFFSANKVALQFPVVKLTNVAQQEQQQQNSRGGQSINVMPIQQAYVGKSQLADAKLQPGIFAAGKQTISGIEVQYNAITHFIPSVHKYTSGMASRGSFLFLKVDSISKLVLPAYGSSNAVPIANCNTSNPGYIIPIVFQTRMCDRLGCTDVSHDVRTENVQQEEQTRGDEPIIVNNRLRPSNNGTNFTYSKTITICLRTSNDTITFDLTMKRSWR
jgi:hypothetical protein